MSQDRRQLGAAGESAAGKFLERQGFRILARNYSCPTGEIDLIGFHEGCIVFVEIKTRAQDDDAPPEDTITTGKRRRMHRAARHWLAANRQPDCAYRFDAVSVVMSPGNKPDIRHIIEAFIPQ